MPEDMLVICDLLARRKSAGRRVRVPVQGRAPACRGVAALASTMILAACATAPFGQADLLDFIGDGQTTREDALMRLGAPSASYENERIVTYRLGKDKGGFYPVAKRQGFYDVEYSLVLAFDDTGVLKRHSLVALKVP